MRVCLLFSSRTIQTFKPGPTDWHLSQGPQILARDHVCSETADIHDLGERSSGISEHATLEFQRLPASSASSQSTRRSHWQSNMTSLFKVQADSLVLVKQSSGQEKHNHEPRTVHWVFLESLDGKMSKRETDNQHECYGIGSSQHVLNFGKRQEKHKICKCV